MGEAKRRKQLDPNYGKSRIPKSTFVFIDTAVNTILKHGLKAVIVATPESYDVYSTKQIYTNGDVLIVDFESEKAITTDQLKTILKGATPVLQVR